MSGGFGWSFYGFFVFAAAWIAGYFAWATWMNRRARRRDSVLGTRYSDDPKPKA